MNYAPLSLQNICISFLCYPNKLSQILWDRTTEIYSLTVLEAQSPKPVLLGQNQSVGGAVLPPQAVREKNLAVSCFFQLPASADCHYSLACGLWLHHSIPASVITLSSPLLCVSNLPLSPFYEDACDCS